MQKNKLNTLSSSPAIALGNFDGVHLGHRAIIEKTVDFAQKNGLTPALYTFEKHPDAFLSNKKIVLLTNNAEKEEILSSLGIETIYFDNFAKVCNMLPEEFCEKILIEKLKCKAVFCGENFRFGKNASGNAQALKEILSLHNIPVFVEEFVRIDGETVSSTLIRKLLSEGNAEKARELLSRPFCLSAEVIHGEALGRILGFPTINQLYPAEKAPLAFGVYAVNCHIDGKIYHGVANVGVKPTVTGDKKDTPVLCETHIIDFSGDVYGKNVKICFYKMIRPEKRFSGLDELCKEIADNVRKTQNYFKENCYDSE